MLLGFLLLATPSASAKDLGGHVGVVVPVASVSNRGTSTLADGFTFGVPLGFGKAVSERWVVDMEFVPLFVNGTTVDLVVHPGAVFKLGGGFGVGARAAFEVASNAVGGTLIANKGFANGWFVEAVVPVRTVSDVRDRTTSVSFALHTGIGF